MREAAEDLAEQQPDAAAEHQEEALRILKEEDYELAQLRQRIQELAEKPLEEQAAEQGELAEQTDRTAENMDGGEDSQATPGQQSVSEAGESMAEASEQLGGEGSPSDQAGQANAEQQEAIEKLAEALEDLAEAIAREQEMLEAEQLAQIDRMLQKILEGQKAITASTEDAYGARRADDTYDRQEQLKLSELSRGEATLAEDTRRVQAILEDEDSTAVFPVVLGQVADQQATLEQRLADEQAGPVTQAIQRDVEQTLEEMIAAIREELSDRRRQQAGGGGGGGGGGGEGPLVPPVAELKLLWRMQRRIAEQTAELNTTTGELTDEQAAARHEQLADRQEQLEQMTRELHEKINQ